MKSMASLLNKDGVNTFHALAFPIFYPWLFMMAVYNT
jgi:hypothetical protein